MESGWGDGKSGTSVSGAVRIATVCVFGLLELGFVPDVTLSRIPLFTCH